MELTKITPKQIDLLEAGGEIDRLVAASLMGLTLHIFPDTSGRWENAKGESVALPKYSNDIAAAWLVAERLTPHRLFLNDTGEGWRAWFVHDDPPGKPGIQGDGATPALAICRAALKTIIKEKP